MDVSFRLVEKKKSREEAQGRVSTGNPFRIVSTLFGSWSAFPDREQSIRSDDSNFDCQLPFGS
jgi:hypothetical protein